MLAQKKEKKRVVPQFEFQLGVRAANRHAYSDRLRWADSGRSPFAGRAAGWGSEADVPSARPRSKRRALTVSPRSLTFGNL
jgi:hypothetical protein